MTTAVDNIHWFTPETQSATTFDVIISDFDPGQDSFVIQPIDPLGGEKQRDHHRAPHELRRVDEPVSADAVKS